MTISKEISTLENDMVELKELLAQWKDLPQLMGMEDTLAPRLDKEGNCKPSAHTAQIVDCSSWYSGAAPDTAQLSCRSADNV